jgi:hemerythrin
MTMDWRVGYPSEYSYLDDEHEEIARLLDQMRIESEEGRDKEARGTSVRILGRVKAHAKSEDGVMREQGFPERDLHHAYHQHVITALETVLKLFDHGHFAQHGNEVVRHIQNRLAEEVFVDGLLARFLADGKPSAKSRPRS